MKVALVTDCLTEFGGAERILLELKDIYPNTEIFTSVANSIFLRKYLPNARVHAVMVGQNFFVRHTSLFQAMAPLLWRFVDLRGFDVVIAISGHMMCNFVQPSGNVFIQYLLSPPKNIYHIVPKTNLQRIIPYEIYLKYLYAKALKQTSHLVTISKNVQKIFINEFRLNTQVIYPPVKVPRCSPKKRSLKYFLCVSRIDKTKGLELPIIACSQLDFSLKVVGTTSDSDHMIHLRSIAGPSVEFLGFVPDDELPALYSEAKAFIFPSKDEDFGISPIEAMSYGVPVIAYASGGVKETMISGVTGLFFDPYSVRGLVRTLLAFQSYRFDSDILYRHAYRFRTQRFINEIRKYVSSITKKDDVS